MVAGGVIRCAALVLLLAGCDGTTEDDGGGSGSGGNGALTNAGMLSFFSIAPSETQPDGFDMAWGRFWEGHPPPCFPYQQQGCQALAACIPPPEAGLAEGAGAIELHAQREVTLLPPDYEWSGEERSWGPLGSIAFDANGDPGGPPAFSAELLAPSYPLLTQPEPPEPGATLTLDRSQALEVTWSEAEQGDVLLLVTSVHRALEGFACRWQGGFGSVPASFMSYLSPTEPGDPETYWDVQLLGYSDTRLSAGSFEIVASATASRRESLFSAEVR
jgi:hypothetical protein